ncbi:FecR family protein [Sphingobacterium thalpophilum]|uniref:FecR family protein n=1 Tax=Sphingobacterium thalpophilum TaxID=259 RepID=UPI0024A690D0|nr:FecR family protein [Sphingobacterium thalpophilum]
MSKVEAYKKLIRQYYQAPFHGEALKQFINYMDDEDFLDAWEQIRLEDTTDPDTNTEMGNQISFEKIAGDARLKQALIRNTPVKKIHRFTSRNIILAATLLLFLVGAWAYHFYTSGSSPVSDGSDWAQQVETIVPGKDRAQIILENGHRIDLEKIKGDTVIDNGGFEIIKTASGSISYRIKAGADPHKLVYNTIITPGGGEYHLTLPDGSRVWLNASTTLKYPVIFDKSKREVEMQGEAYFEITKQMEKGKRVPFIIHSGAQSIEVLGTAFNVQNYGKKIVTTLVEGKIRLNFKASQLEDQILTPNEQAVFESGTNRFSKDPIDPFYYTAWKDGNFAFHKTPLTEVMEIIGRWYDVQIQFQSTFENFQFTGTISKYSDIKKLLQTIELVGGVHFELKGRKIYVKK